MNILIIQMLYIKKFLLIIIIFILFWKKNELKTLKNLSLGNNNEKGHIIRLAILSFSLKNGGVERNTAILIDFLSKVKIFEIYLFTEVIKNKEYKISKNIKRVNISFNSFKKN